MGKIKKLLASGHVPYRTITPTALWTDLCENIHIHYRNLRLDLSETEFAKWRGGIHSLGLRMEEQAEADNYKEGDPNYLVHMMYNNPFSHDSDYYPNRVTIEYERDNTVHFHYRDLRIHMTNEEFLIVADMFVEARAKYDEVVTGKFDPPFKDIEVPTLATVDINLIQPYDPGHLPLAMDKKHRQGVDFVKELIKAGEKIRPILVNTDGQRLDGFKRYMAQKEAGLTEIEVLVDPHGKMGGQDGESFLADKQEAQNE